MSNEPEKPQEPEKDARLEGIPADDPFPKIFVVCFAIFLVLGTLIFGVIAYDLTQSVDQRVVPSPGSVERPVPAPAESPVSEGGE